jgi:hypothetical protein
VAITFDKRILKSGDSLLSIFGELAISNFLFCILSRYSAESNWVRKELSVAIVKEIEDPRRFKVIPIIPPGEDFETIRKSLPSDLNEALRDKQFSVFKETEYFEELHSLLSAIQVNPEEVFVEIEGENSTNPFRRVRTEYFEDFKTIARSFAEPERVRYDRIIEIKPTRIEGGRGSGKTMILKSLEANVCVPRCHAQTFQQTKLDYFGVYCRLGRGAFVTQGGCISEHLPNGTENVIFLNEFIIRLVQALLKTIEECRNNGFLTLIARQEKEIACLVWLQIRKDRNDLAQPTDLASVLNLLETELRIVNEYVCRKILNENVNYDGVFLNNTQLKEICKGVRNAIPELADITIYFLLDEYENLLPFQKVVVNTFLKWSERGFYSVKIATKKKGFDDPQTLEGQEIQEAHDYSTIDMDYDILDKKVRKSYRDLLKAICSKILANEGFKVTDIENMLVNNPQYDSFDKSDIDSEIDAIIKEMKGKQKGLFSLDKESQESYRNKLTNSAVYRLAWRKRQGIKRFAGVDDFVFLSSGIIRYFLELCGMAYYYAVQDGKDLMDGDKIEVVHQTQGAYALSQHYYNTITKDIADYGSRIQQLLTDLGAIFRTKLLHHPSEPEAARVSVEDPQRLYEESEQMRELRQVLDTAERYSVFQIPSRLGGMRPKQLEDVQPIDYLPNRIYAPLLMFSMHPRWRTFFNCYELYSLLDAKTRDKMKGQLIENMGGKRSSQAILSKFSDKDSMGDG